MNKKKFKPLTLSSIKCREPNKIKQKKNTEKKNKSR